VLLKKCRRSAKDDSRWSQCDVDHQPETKNHWFLYTWFAPYSE